MSQDETTSPLSDAAQQRLQRWLTSPGLRAHFDQAIDTARRPLRTGPYIAISRKAGTGGAAIAALIGTRLDWDVLDKHLLDFIAQRFGTPRSMLEFVDETRANWLHDVLSSWIDSQVVSHEKFVVYLQRVVYLAAMYGRVVFVGRGAHCMLPRASGLTVRLDAPREFRVAHLMNAQHKTRREAEKTLNAIDAGRTDFHRRFFGRAAEDPHAFDLTINVAHFTPEAAADIVVTAFEQREREHDPSIG